MMSKKEVHSLRDAARRKYLRAAGLVPLWALGGAGSAVSANSAWAAPQPVGTANARRLVCLGGSLTEMVYVLGVESLLVGTDTTSLYPEAALHTAKVGYMRALSAEGLLSLRPDAVVGTDEAGPRVVLDQVRSAGVAVDLVKVDHSFAEVERKLQLIGRVTGRAPQANQIKVRIRAEWAQVQQKVARAAQKPRMLFILAHTGSPMVAGTDTAADALIRFAGGVNAASSFRGYRPLTGEAMASAAPQVLINTSQGMEALGGDSALWQRPEMKLTPAFRRRALVAMDANYLLGFGPRLPQAVAELHTRTQAFVT